MRLSITLLSRMMKSEVNIFNGWFGYGLVRVRHAALCLKYKMRTQTVICVCLRARLFCF